MGVRGQSGAILGYYGSVRGIGRPGGGGGERVSQGAYGGMRSAREHMGVRGQSGGHFGGNGSVTGPFWGIMGQSGG